jgi:ABC-type dipeptide/oligopeptide/nickel transport system permease subunit
VLDARARARFASSRSARIGVAIVATLVLFAIFGPMLAKHGPFESDFANGVAPDTGPSADFPFGADRIFRDVFARLAAGGRLSLAIALAATLLSSSIGAVVGIIAGYLEGRRTAVPWPAFIALLGGAVCALLGRPTSGAAVLGAGIALSLVARFGGPRLDVDGLLMRFVDVLLAFPFLLLVMAIGAALQRTSVLTILVTLGVTGWLGIARVVRAKTMQVRAHEYVLASRALGQSTPRILLSHVLPNVAGTLVVMATMQVAQMIVADSVLAYLGVGISPPTPTWGRMLFEGQDYYVSAPWLVAAPATAILLAVWGFNMLGEGLRDALDPHEA